VEAGLEGPAIALVELESIARGFVVADQLVKRAEVTVVLAEPLSPGKYLLLFHGGVAEVEESFKAATETAGPRLLDSLFLTQAASGLMDGLEGRFAESWGDSVGIVETQTVAAALLACDSSLKRAGVQLKRLHLARGIGGKGYFVVTGSLDQTQSALEAAGGAVNAGLLLGTELLERPDPALFGTVL
jgi:microcompartment protein CcmL/EutN